MDTFVDKAMAFLDICEECNSLPSLVAEFSKTLSAFGFNYFMMTRLPALGEDAEPYVIAHTWPKAWLDRYREGQFFWHDPVGAYSLAEVRPFSWKEARTNSRQTRIARQIASEARSVGLRDGLGFPMGDPSSVQSVVSLASDQMVDLPPLARQMLHLVCLNAEFRGVELHEATTQRFARLTPREREVLTWIANGKSLADTGQILTIAERSVREHMVHARQKLGAATTGHAIAKAIKSRQIIL